MAAKVYGVISQKGGVGKTTTSVNLATGFALRDLDVLLIDTESTSQASAMNWHKDRIKQGVEPRFTVSPHDTPTTLHQDIKKLGKGYDVVIVDGAPRNDELARSVIASADVVIIPMAASKFDVNAGKNTIKLLQEARMHTAKLACFLVNKAEKHTNLHASLMEQLVKWDETTDIALLQSQLGLRVAFAESAGGVGVLETAPASTAGQELTKLIDELMEKYHGN
jgi:chromosome partitioning protein